jgi:hypothetical protein
LAFVPRLMQIKALGDLGLYILHLYKRRSRPHSNFYVKAAIVLPAGRRRPDRSGFPMETSMYDALMVAIGCGFFVAAVLYALACEKM